MKQTNSRGKRNRIKRKIARLEGTEVPELYRPKKKEKKDKKNDDQDDESGDEGTGRIEVSQEMQKLLKANQKKQLTQEQVMEEQIKKEVKRNKKKRKDQKKSEEYDDIMKSFEDRINKRLKTLEEAGDEKPKDDGDFDQVSVEED